MKPIYDLAPAVDAVAALLPGVDDEALDAATPCPNYRVRDLLFHLIGLSIAFRDAAAKIDGPTTSTPPEQARGSLPEDWRTRLPKRMTQLAEAWRRPDAWDGMTRTGGVDLPAAVAGNVAINELLIHGWDLARATGQPYAPADTVIDAGFDLLTPTGGTVDDDGPFGPPVPVPDDSPRLDRVVGLSGRSPGWRPPR